MPKTLLFAKRRFIVILALATSLLVLMATPAAAHTEFASSSPADGETIREPVSEISLTYAGEASPAGEGFVVLDSEGAVRLPNEVMSSDNLTWTLRFDEPLTGGVVGVRWKVAAPDAHPIEGSFSFTVDAPAIASVTPTTTPPITTTIPTPTMTTAVAAEPPATDTNEITGNAADPEIDSSSISQSAEQPVELTDFLDTGDASAAGVARVADLGRVASLLGVILAFGGVAFAALTLRGERSDIRAVLFWVRRAGVLTMAGVVVEAAAQVATLSSGWSGVWSPSALSDGLVSSFGVAVALRLAGAALVTTGAKLDIHQAEIAADPIASVKQLTAVGARSTPGAPTHSEDAEPALILHDGDDAWHIAKSPAAFVGAALLALSYLFDGHTVSEGPRWLHALANTVHVTTAATWAGGVVMLALVIARRHRRNADTRALQLAVRFSVVATIALVGAGLAGVALTVVILESVSDIWSTPWGQLLIVKVLLVGVAAAGGGYNHRIVIPALQRSPGDKGVAHRFRTIVTLEAIALVAVTLTTGLLIAASST